MMEQHTLEHTLVYAAWNDEVDVIKQHLTNPNMEVARLGGGTMLHTAATNNSVNVINMLLSSPHIDINRKNKLGSTALHNAAYREYHLPLSAVDALKLLLTSPDIDVNIQDNVGCTALHQAAISKASESIKVLLKRSDIDVNIQHKHGETALHMAVRVEVDSNADNMAMDVVKSLLERSDIDVNIKDNHGKTPILLAGTNVTKELLMRPDLDVSNLQFAITTAISNLNYNDNIGKFMEIINATDIDINIEDGRGNTALYVAAMTNMHFGVKMLLSRDDIKVDVKTERAIRDYMERHDREFA